MRYSKASLIEAVSNVDSVNGVIRYLGGNPGSGGTFQHVKSKLLEFSIDISHFTGLSANRGKTPMNKKSAEEILLHEPERTSRRSGHRLRRSLAELGREHKCVACGLRDSWNGKPLQLEVDHIDSDWRNNLAGNLQLLCPNCHQQATSLRSRDSKIVPLCTVCDAPISTEASKCRSCASTGNFKIEWPSDKDLGALLWSMPTSSLAKQLHVTDSAIAKRAKLRGLSKPPRGYWSKIASGRK